MAILRDQDLLISIAVLIPSFSAYLKQHIYALKMSQPSIYYYKVFDLLNADERRLLSYLKKRIPCSTEENESLWQP